MCKLSIIVPVYNAAEKIAKGIESVINQEFEDWQLILINDGSKDNTKDILDIYAQKDKRIKVVHKRNSGVSATRNLGLQLAQGKYIQFMDADDWLPVQASKLLVREMEENDVDMVIGDFYRVVNDNVSVKGSISKAGVISRKEYADNMLLTPADFYYGVLWNKLYKKSLIDEFDLKMDSNISFCEDMIFNLEYLLHVDNIAVLKAPVYYYVKTEGSLVEKSSNLPAIIKMKKSVITYYNDFYKNTLDQHDYLERMPIIYGYYLAFATDSLSLPFIKSYKLGQEKGETVFLNDQMSSSLMMNNYLRDKLVDQYLNTLATQFDLENNDIKLLYCLYLANQSLTIEQLAGYSALTNLVTVVSIGKLLTKGYIKKEKQTYLLVTNEELIKKFKDVQLDCDNICFKDLNEEEISLYHSLQNKITYNIENYLKK